MEQKHVTKYGGPPHGMFQTINSTQGHNDSRILLGRNAKIENIQFNQIPIQKRVDDQKARLLDQSQVQNIGRFRQEQKIKNV